MAYIDGSYTTAATILKDLARVLSTANVIKEPQEVEQLFIQDDNGTLFIETSKAVNNAAVEGGPENFNITFYDVIGEVFNGSVVGVGYKNGDKYKIEVSGALEGEEYIVKYDADKDSELIFPERRSDDGDGGPTFAVKLDQIEDQLNRINENQRFIIKMNTTKDKKPLSMDPFNEDPEHDIRETSMYIEFKKPKYVINHETMDYGSIDDEGTEFTMKNNHHFFVRMIDKVDDVTGIIDPTAIISNWAKMSWSLDYKEELTIIPDEIIPGGGDAMLQAVGSVRSDLVATPLPNFCNAESMFIQFYVHCDNDKINLVIKGNDDVALNDYLLSYAYIGKIKSFVDDDTGYTYANDIIGNFAMTVGSSTVPVEYPRELPPANVDVDMNSVLRDIKAFDDSTTGIDSDPGAFEFKFSIQESLLEPTPGGNPNWLNFVAPQVMVNYRVVFVGDDFETFPSNILSASMYKYLYTTRNFARDVALFTPSPIERIMDIDFRTNDTEYKMQPKLHINIPIEIQDKVKKVKIFKSIAQKWENDEFYQDMIESDDNTTFNEMEVDPPEGAATKTDKFYLLEEVEVNAGMIIDENYVYTDILGHEIMLTNDKYVVKPDNVRRYNDNNAIKEVIFSDRFGIDSSATGVNDILMFKTRIGSYYQKHFPAFMTPDEMMRKHGFNVSKWTDRVHITPVYIVHPGDGYRGELMDVLFLTKTNMKNGDILIINEGKDNEEKYKFFKVNAPFSCLNASPDYNSGVAIRYIKYD
jgi:hypothetical protein